MLRNYLKVVWRTVLRLKSYTFINVAGLSVRMVCIAREAVHDRVANS